LANDSSCTKRHYAVCLKITRGVHPARSLVQPFENITATLIYPIDGGYKRLVNRPAASAVAKASGEGAFLRAKEAVAADELVEFAWKPLHLLALPGVKGIAGRPKFAKFSRPKISYGTGRLVAPTVRSILISSGRFISLPQRQPPLNILKESLVDVSKAMQISACLISSRSDALQRTRSRDGW
jgi:hypothetical protein